MAKDKEPFEPLKGIAKQTAEQITGRTQEAMENYFGWLQQTMSASPWGSTDLNKKLLRYATENVSAVFGLCRNSAKPRIWKTSSKFRRSS